ncbi:MAG: Tim44 domain-containing protein [Rhodospirillales bacterium]|nr:MAG: Tim44 domain-containing protein [Rhodospirillales bacterium]
MGGGFQVFDIILFAILALFLIYRLGSVLGRRHDDQKHRTDPFGLSSDQQDAMSPEQQDPKGDNVIAMHGRGESPVEDGDPMDPLEAGLAQIKSVDRSFREREFVKGARTAFEMIVGAFAAGDGKVLKSLLDDPVYENFAAAIREREKAGQTLETTLVGIEQAEIVSAELQGRNAMVTVKFVSGQVNATHDANGEVVDGDPNNVVQVTDIWTFGRDTRSSDPNWVLIATGSSD